MSLLVAIDGPGGSGKSTVSRLVGSRLGLPHLDTGAYYRAATLLALRAGTNLADGQALAAEAARHSLELKDGRMLIDGDDESLEIRGTKVTAAVSEVSAHPEVRSLLVEAQRDWVAARGGSGVVEGRDIGTVVFPQATVKVFLTAHPEVRARRRARQVAADTAWIESDLARRDRYDVGRQASPLRPADDAVELDTSDLSIEQVVTRIVELARHVESR